MSARRASLGSIVAVIALILSSPLPARAQGPRHDDPSLARVSDVIVTGRVVHIGSARDPQVGFIYTYVTIAVSDHIKGSGIGDELVVKQLGGQVGDTGMVVYDQASFRMDEEVLLFLIERPRDATLQTTAFWQGKWTISRDGTLGEAVAVRAPFGAMDRIGVGTPSPEESRPLEPFLAELRSWSRAQEPVPGRQRQLVTHPLELPAVTAEAADRTPTFTFLGPARWNQPDSLLPVYVDIQAGGEPGLEGGGFSELSNARNLWNGAGSSLALANGQTVLTGATKTQACSSANNSNSGRLTIYFDDPCDEIGGDRTLAVGGFFYSTAGGVTVNGTHFDRITSGYLINSDEPGVQDALDRSRCFQDVQTHEMGHSIGLGHSTVPGSIMQAFLDDACYSVTTSSSEAAITGGLGPDDRDAINFIYPSRGVLTNDPSVAPGPPRGLSYQLVGDRVILEWLPPASGGPVQSYQIQGGADPGRLNYVNFDTFQNATKINLRIKDGEYYIRVLAKNGAGTSDSSNEVNFIVAGNPEEPNPEFVQPTLNFTSDSSGNIRVMGEMQNRFIGPGPATFIRVQATFLAADGSVVGTDSAYVLGRSRRLRDTGVVTDTALAAGQRGCFMIVTNVPASRVDSVLLSGTFSIFSNDPLDGRLRLAGFGRSVSDGGTLQLDGAARNIGSRTTYFNKVVFDVKTPKVQTCTFANVQGSTIALPGGGTTSTALAPGAVGSFSTTTDVPVGRLEIRTYTQWSENAPAGSGASLQALARINDDVAADFVRLQADQERLWRMLTGAEASSAESLHRLRNDIEARLQRIQRRSDTEGLPWRLPFAEQLRVPVRRNR
ncbi:MAG: matrixin family metalloprotease [Acidobacteriota bacterium]|jgi:hypothetical protein